MKLKRCPWFRDKTVDTQRQVTQLSFNTSQFKHFSFYFFYKVDHFLQIGRGLSGQTDHEIQFKVFDAGYNKIFSREKDIFFSYTFINNPPQPLRGTIRSDCGAF